MTEIPPIGLGTWKNEDTETCAESVEVALEAGYRHIDTAQVYGNEEAVGDGIARSDVPRDEVFLATKIWISNLSYDDVHATARESLDRLGVGYVDILYVHWHAGAYDADETLRAFDELHDDGLVRNIGVSNFTPEHIEEAREVLDAPIAANQVEMHPLLPQDEMRRLADETGFDVVAYSPLGRGEVLDLPEIREVADRHDATPAQVALAWSLEKGAKPIPKSANTDRVRENYGALGVSLDADDVTLIDSVERRERFVEPDFAPDW